MCLVVPLILKKYETKNNRKYSSEVRFLKSNNKYL